MSAVEKECSSLEDARDVKIQGEADKAELSDTQLDAVAAAAVGAAKPYYNEGAGSATSCGRGKP